MPSTVKHPIVPPNAYQFINGITAYSMPFEIMLTYLARAEPGASPMLLSCVYGTENGDRSVLIGRVNDAQYAVVDAGQERSENPLDLLPTEVQDGYWGLKSKESSPCELGDRPLWDIETGYDQLLLGDEQLEPG